MKDFPASKMDQVLPFEKGKSWFNNDYLGRFGIFSGLYTILRPNGPMNQGPKEPVGKTLEELCKESGDVTCLNLKEYDELI